MTAVPDNVAAPQICIWRHHAFGVDLHCRELVVPGSPWCPDHLITAAADGTTATEQMVDAMRHRPSSERSPS